MSGEVTTPSGKKEIPTVIDNNNGTISIKYQPSQKGNHELAIYFDGEHISGSPIKFYADAVAPGHVHAFGPGLSHGKVNESTNFTVVTKDAGAGTIIASI